MDKLNVNSNHFRTMYAGMGVNIDKLGCIMLDLADGHIPELLNKEDLYHTTHPDRFWINGFVGGATPHVTLLYGLMHSGNTIWRSQVDQVLGDWKPEPVMVSDVSFFESPFADEPYYCIIAHLKISDNLLEGHKRLEFLPHINTFPEYKAHITLAYVKKDEAIRDNAINKYVDKLIWNTIPVTGLNYGK